MTSEDHKNWLKIAGENRDVTPCVLSELVSFAVLVPADTSDGTDLIRPAWSSCVIEFEKRRA